MKEVFEQYGGVLITCVAVLSVVGLVAGIFAVGDDKNYIKQAFQTSISGFFKKADANIVQMPGALQLQVLDDGVILR